MEVGSEVMKLPAKEPVGQLMMGKRSLAKSLPEELVY